MLAFSLYYLFQLFKGYDCREQIGLQPFAKLSICGFGQPIIL